jgi:hypothetical protein
MPDFRIIERTHVTLPRVGRAPGGNGNNLGSELMSDKTSGYGLIRKYSKFE